MIPTAAPGCGMQSRLTTRQALANDSFVMYIFCQARVMSMLGFDNKTGNRKSSCSKTDNLVRKVVTMFKHSIVVVDEVHTTSTKPYVDPF